MADNKKFSSRVLNMKFMRKAEEVNKQEEEELLSKKLQDMSEWKLPTVSTKVKQRLVNKNKIKKVGYSSIMNDDQNLTGESAGGRKKWGEPVIQQVDDEVENSKKTTKSERESKQFLDQLWKTQRREDDSILDSLKGGISGAGSTSTFKRKPSDDNGKKDGHKRTKY